MDPVERISDVERPCTNRTIWSAPKKTEEANFRYLAGHLYFRAASQAALFLL